MQPYRTSLRPRTCDTATNEPEASRGRKKILKNRRNSHAAVNERDLLRALPQSSSDIMQKGLDFVREQSGTVTPPDPGVPRDPAAPAAWLKVELPALETGTGRMGSLAFKYLHGGQ
jgi:hypothetical protein